MTPEGYAEKERELAELAEMAVSKKHKRDIVEAYDQLKWERAKSDAFFFCTELATTVDEHDKDNPYKPLPKHEFVRILVEEWVKAPAILLIPKSRQMHCSWIFVMLHLWASLVEKGNLTLIQSKKEEDANKLIERAAGIYRRLPQIAQRECPAEILAGKIKFQSADNIIQGIPQGAHQIRMNVPRRLLSDEMAFQEEAEEAFVAAMPCLENGGMFTGLSSAAPSFMQELVVDTPQKVGTFQQLYVPDWTNERGPTGVCKWETTMGVVVVQPHYSADPRKNDDWANREAEKYPGGLEGKGWRAEQEIDWGAKQGGKVYAMFSRDTHVIPDMKIPEDWAKFRGIDPGYHNPFACVWVAVDGDGTFYIYDEYYERGKTVPQAASAIKAKTGRQEIEWTVADPAFKHKTMEGGGRSIQMQLGQAGVYAHPGDNRVQDGIQAVAERLALHSDSGEPRLKVLESCTQTIWEFESYRYKELSEQQKREKNETEVPLKKDDHLMDAIRYVIMNAPADYLRRSGREDPWTSDLVVSTLSARARGHLTRVRMERQSDNDGWDD